MNGLIQWAYFAAQLDVVVSDPVSHVVGGEARVLVYEETTSAPPLGRPLLQLLDDEQDISH